MKPQQLAQKAKSLHNDYMTETQGLIPFSEWVDKKFLTPAGPLFEYFLKYDTEVKKGPNTQAERFGVFESVFGRDLLLSKGIDHAIKYVENDHLLSISEPHADIITIARQLDTIKENCLNPKPVDPEIETSN